MLLLGQDERGGGEPPRTCATPRIRWNSCYDVLRDEAQAYARRLQAAGVAAKFRRYGGMIHGFIRRYPFFDQGKAAIAEVGRELRTALSTTDRN